MNIFNICTKDTANESEKGCGTPQKASHKMRDSTSGDLSQASGLIDELRADHRELSYLYKRVLQEGPPSNGSSLRLFDELKTKFKLHAQAEESVLYKVLRARAQESENNQIALEVLESREEHEMINHLFKELSARDPMNETWLAMMIILSETIQHHFEKEEGNLFRDASTQFTPEELLSLGRKFVAEKYSLLIAG